MYILNKLWICFCIKDPYSVFAKKAISLANKDLLRQALRDFKIKGGRSSTFLIKLLVDQYYKSGISLCKSLFNLLKRDYVVV